MTTLLKISLFYWTALGFPNISTDPYSDNCTLTIQSEVEFAYERKMVDGNTFSGASNLPNEHGGNLSAGTLEICINQEGFCHWRFQTTEGNGEHLNLKVLGLDEIIKYLQIGSSKLSDYLTSAKSKGGILSDLGNQTSSIRIQDPQSGRTVVTLIDKQRAQILGASVYKNDRELEAKLICQYKSENRGMKPDIMTLSVIEKEAGTDSAMMTEIIARYQN